MPIPLIPVITALAAGGSLVPHAAGGMIVSSAAAGGYVAGTYLSTSAIGAVIAMAGTTLGLGSLWLSGAAASIVGSAGIFGTTLGASGITGMLMSAGLISSTPIWVPLALGGAAVGCGYGSYLFWQLQQKIKSTPAGEEAQFTETEAQFIERVVKLLDSKEKSEK